MVPFQVYPNTHLAVPKVRSTEQPWSQFPLLIWDDDDKCETVSNAEVCKTLKRVSNKVHENLWTEVHKSLKDHLQNVRRTWRNEEPNIIQNQKQDNWGTHGWSLWLHVWGHRWPMNRPRCQCPICFESQLWILHCVLFLFWPRCSNKCTDWRFSLQKI